MDNSQFRSFINDDKRKAGSTPAGAQAQEFKTPMLGSRARPSIPMTPRSIAGYNSANDFARQVAEQRRLADGEPPTKKFRSSAAPKGTKLKQGYQDRTILRRAVGNDEETQDEREKRLKALEEMFKLQQIDDATFEKLKSAIGIGGDVSSTHLVKGLDWKLLERVKQGEDISKIDQEEEDQESMVDVDNELDSVLQKEVSTADMAAQNGGKGDATPLENTTGQLLSRDEILRRLKAGRTSTPMAPPPPPGAALSDRFKKVGSGSKAEKKKFVEVINGRRREVLLTTDKEGRTKRKVRWLDKEATNESPAPDDAVQQPLGMEVPAEIAARQKALLEQQQIEEDDDDDIFAGVGADYDPLAGLIDNSEGDSVSAGEVLETQSKPGEDVGAREPLPAKFKQNYFRNTEQAEEESSEAPPGIKDPTIMAALKKAAGLRQSQGGEDQDKDDGHDILTDQVDPERALRQKQFLEKLKQREREDARDLDMGFGESRFGDEEDEDGPMWEDGDDETKEKSGSRKRGPKKRKGNKDNVGDVMSVIERRKKAGN